MKRFILAFLFCVMSFNFISCGCNGCKAIELMGAGDRIHDSYTFANTGVEIKEMEENYYEISGSVEKLTNQAVKNEFKIDEDIEHIVAIKLTAINSKVDKNNVSINVNGNRNYDAEHLNGSDYTFILLEAVKGSTVSISVKWNNDDSIKTYTIKFSDDLTLL